MTWSFAINKFHWLNSSMLLRPWMLMKPALTVAYTEQESHMATKLKDIHTFKYGRTFCQIFK